MSASEKPTLVAPHLLNLQGARPSLNGSRCTFCSEVYFPVARGCTRCGSTALEAFDLGHAGRLWSWTIQGFRPKPPYDSGETDADFAPYGVGYVELASGLKVESRLTVADAARLRIGMPMALTLQAYRGAPDGAPVHTFAFEPVDPALEVQA